MPPPESIQLIVQGGAIAALSIGLWLLVTGKLRTGKGYDDQNALWRERLVDAHAERDEWKALAKELGPAVKRLADALESKNRRDEQARRGGDAR